jgi:hypothetical protein
MESSDVDLCLRGYCSLPARAALAWLAMIARSYGVSSVSGLPKSNFSLPLIFRGCCFLKFRSSTNMPIHVLEILLL